MKLFGKHTDSLTLEDFKSSFDLYYETIRNFVYYKVGDIAIAEDLTQDTFVKIWDKRADVKKETLKNLAYTIAGNLAKNHFKHQKVVLDYEKGSGLSDQSKETPEYQLEVKEFQEKLQGSIDALPDGNREVFLMNRIDKLTYQEIADRLGLSVKAIEKRMHKALVLLRETLEYRI